MDLSLVPITKTTPALLAGSMKHFEQKNIYEVLQPLFAWTKLLGLSPFVVKRDGYKLSGWSLTFSLVLLLLLAVISVNIIIRKEFDPKDGLITNVTEVLELYTTNINMIISILFSCINRKKVLNVIDSIQKMDTGFNSSFLSVDFKKIYKKTAIQLTAVVFGVNIYLFISFLLDVYIFWFSSFFYSAMMAFAFICPKLITSFSIIQFCYLNILLKQRFNTLNMNLHNITDVLNRSKKPNKELVVHSWQNSRTVSHINPNASLNDKVSEAIETIRLKHFNLCDIGSDLNYAYTVQILFTSLQTFVTLLSGLFYCIKDILSDQTETVGIIIAYTMNAAFLSFSQIASVAVICSNTVLEARKTGQVLHKHVPKTTNKELEIEFLYFSLQLLHHNVEFTACRMFLINENLLLSMIGVICTYLVIVIQFEFGISIKDAKESLTTISSITT